jgi:histidine triad (HIT) family protein
MNCIFCNISNKSIPANIVLENDDMIAFRDVNPQTPDHILVIPKKHITSISEISSPEDINLIGKLLFNAKQIANNLGHAEKGYRIVINTGENGGQTVFHLHVHLLAGKPMNWPPG